MQGRAALRDRLARRHPGRVAPEAARRRGARARGPAAALLGAGLALAPAAGGAPPGAAELELPAGVALVEGRYLSERDGMELVLVPAGEFQMGSETGSHDERPVHAVFLGAFLIDKHEVRNQQFERFVRESGFTPAGPWRRGFGPGEEDLPVRFVTWHDARAYARWAGRRLPSEAQWEKAARGAAGLRYPWGDAWREGVARVDRAPGEGPAPVGSFPEGASPYGALDLAGNVWEWVADWYDRYYYRSLPGDGAIREPRGPEDGAPPEPRFVETGTAGGNERSTRKVIRGGGWVAGGRENARGAKRTWGNPGYWLNDTGFRCALPLGE